MDDFPRPVAGEALNNMIFGRFADARCVGGTRGALPGDMIDGLNTVSSVGKTSAAVFDGPRPPRMG
jgi:hypothetical protein